MVHHLQIPSLLLANLRARRGWSRDRLQHRQARRAGRRLNDARRSVLHLVGSAVDEFHAELSRLYAGACLEALAGDDALRHAGGLRVARRIVALPRRSRRRLDGRGRSDDARRGRRAHLQASHVDVVVPQMFCLPGMTAYRALFDVLGIPYVGNPPEVMAIAADKAKARAIVAAAGVPVPAGRGGARRRVGPSLTLPVVVKPVDADNSVGRDAGPRGRASTTPAIDLALRPRSRRAGRVVRRTRSRSAVRHRRPRRRAGLPAAGGVRGRPRTKPIRDSATTSSTAPPTASSTSSPRTPTRAWIVPRRRPDHRTRLGGGPAVPRRAGLPALQPVRLPDRPRRQAVVPRGGALLLVRPDQRHRRDGGRRGHRRRGAVRRPR